MTAAWAAAAMLDALRAELARVLDDEHTDRQLIAERTAAKLATVAAAFHATADQAGDGDGDGDGDGEDIEPYCATCGEWIGIFHGLHGWRHFRGDPAPGGQRELYDPDHPAAPAWCVPPGRPLSPAQVRVIGQALAEAIIYHLHYLGRCAACGHDPAGNYPDDTAGAGRASVYGELIAVLASITPESTGEDR